MTDRSFAEKNYPGDKIQLVSVGNTQNELGALQKVSNGEADIKDLSFVQPCNVPEIASSIKTFRDKRFNLRDKDDRKRYGELLKAAAASTKDDMTAWNELAAYRQFELTYDVMASPWALNAYQIVNLSDDELPLIEKPRSRNYQRFTVQNVSIDGETTRNQWRSTKDIIQMEMEMLATEKVSYRLMDLQVGDVNESVAIERELKYDLDMKVDALALANINAGQTASGLRALMKIHPAIVQANIPDKNYLDLDGTDTGVLTVGKLREILAHIAMFGSAGGADEQFSIRNIQISPQNIIDPWSFVSLVSGWDSSSPGYEADPLNTIPESVREAIYNTGMITKAWGQTFSWTPNPQLAKGKMYVFTNRPIGWVFFKPGLDKMLSWDDRTHPDFAERNYGEMMFKKAIKIYMPDIWKQRYLIVDF
jgi:hypothetical protein